MRDEDGNIIPEEDDDAEYVDDEADYDTDDAVSLVLEGRGRV